MSAASFCVSESLPPRPPTSSVKLSKLKKTTSSSKTSCKMKIALSKRKPQQSPPSSIQSATIIQKNCSNQRHLQLGRQHKEHEEDEKNKRGLQGNPKRLPHLDGIRGVALLGVLFFHFSIPCFSGGFVGVDIFFTLSGYLITRNILHSLYTGKFSLVQFYVRRFFRLFPSAAVTVLMTLTIVFFFVHPSTAETIFESAFASLALWSNIFFQNEGGYFDETIVLRPFLHFWSLSVEEQFYMLWPIIILLAWFVSRARSTQIFENVSLVILSVLALSSFIGAQVIHGSYPDLVFYELPFRIFQFAAGALMATYLFPSECETLETTEMNTSYTLTTPSKTIPSSSPPKTCSPKIINYGASSAKSQDSLRSFNSQSASISFNNVEPKSLISSPRTALLENEPKEEDYINDNHDLISVICFLIILISFSFLPVNPSPLTVLPTTLATTFLIGYPRAMIPEFICNSTFLRRTGILSYSIYLTHWPVAQLGKHILLAINIPGVLHLFILLPLSIQAGILLHKYVETPLRYPKSVTSKLFISTVGICALLFSIQGMQTHGFSSRFPEKGNLGWRDALDVNKLKFAQIGIDVTDNYPGSWHPNMHVQQVGNYEKGKRSKYVFFGDSFTEHLKSSLHTIGKRRNEYFEMHFAYHCGFRPTSELPYWTGEKEGYKCSETHTLLWQHINKLPKESVIVVANWWCVPNRLSNVLNNLRIELESDPYNRQFGIFAEPPGMDEKYKTYYPCADMKVLAFGRIYAWMFHKEFRGAWGCAPFEQGIEPEEQIQSERKFYTQVMRRKQFQNVLFFDLFKYMCRRIDDNKQEEEKHLCSVPANLEGIVYTVGYRNDLAHMNAVGSDFVTDFVEMELFGSRTLPKQVNISKAVVVDAGDWIGHGKRS